MTTKNVTVGLCADYNNFLRHQGASCVEHIAAVGDISKKLSLLIVHMETEDEFCSFLMSEDDMLDKLKMCRRLQIPTVLYVPDYAPIVNTKSRDDGRNQFNLLDSVIPIFDYMIIGNELYLDFARMIKGDDRVFQLHPFFNPKLCNPVGIDLCMDTPINELFYDTSYFERNGLVGEALRAREGIRKGLTKADKKLIETEMSDDFSVEYPDVLRSHPFQLALNNHYLSEEYFSRRYVEAYACGSLLFTNYTKAINKYFYNSFIHSINDELVNILDHYSDEQIMRFRCENSVIANLQWSVSRWYEKLFALIGVDGDISERRIYVFVKRDAEKSLRAFDEQLYLDKECVVYDELEEDMLSNLPCNAAITVFDDENTYSPQYLSDFAAALNFASAPCITKQKAPEKRYFTYGSGSLSLSNSIIGRDELVSCKLEITGNSATVFDCEYLQVTDFWLNETIACDSEEYLIGVVYPIHNNGEALYGRGFRSLLRSSVFLRLHLYFIDDGSTDKTTRIIINYLANKYKNITTYFFNDGGSGSAGRPRNKGIELCEEDWIAFEDPDNESISNAYQTFADIIAEDSGIDIVSSRGHYVTCAMGKVNVHPIRESGRGIIRTRVEYDDVSPQSNFKTASDFTNIHKSIFKTIYLRNNNLEFIENYPSEDNLLMLDILDTNPDIVSVSTYKCVYYAENYGSVSNAKGVSKLLGKWIPGTSQVMKKLNGEQNVYYIADKVFKEARSFEDLLSGIGMLENLYVGSGRKFADFKAEWFQSFIRANLNSRIQIIDYFELMNELFYYYYMDFDNKFVMPVIVNGYPTEDNLYNNGFIHRRIVKYKKIEKEIIPVIVWYVPNERISKPEFLGYQGIPIIKCNYLHLDRYLRRYPKRQYFVHFMNGQIWKVIKRYISTMQLVVFLHGFEVLKFEIRRPHLIDAALPENRAKMLADSKTKDALWKDIFEHCKSQDITLVFVSEIFMREVFDDYGLSHGSLGEKVKVIHNVIDTELFHYTEKDVELRKRILLIRPFASVTYANDLAVLAILFIKEHYPEIFKTTEYTICGAGVLFDHIVEPIRDFDNVTLMNRYLTHEEIKELHERNGLFLVPSRCDTQGVSRDEAMSSGLVPITSDAEAITEFVDGNCAVIAPHNDYVELAEGIVRIVKDPELFQRMSMNAAAKVRSLSSAIHTVYKELDLIVRQDNP